MGYTFRREADSGGNRLASDDEPTVEALPDEPTVSAQVDVRAAFEAQDVTMPGREQDRTVQAAVAVLVTSDEPPHRQDHTLPFGARASPIVETPRRAAPRNTLPLITTGVAAPEPAVPQRKPMIRIVVGVLVFCGLLCVGALARQLLPDGKSDAATATPTPTPTATPTPTPTATTATVPDVPPPAPAEFVSPVTAAAPVVTPRRPRPPSVSTPAAKPAGRGIVRDSPF